MTDAEWAVIEPSMTPANRIGRPRETDLREAVNALLYIASEPAWNIDPLDTWVHAACFLIGGDGDVDCGDNCADPARISCEQEADQGDLPGSWAVEAACAEAIDQGAFSSDVVINILTRRREPEPPGAIMTPDDLRLRFEPVADCGRHGGLRRSYGMPGHP